MQTITIKDHEYHIGKISALRQLHLVRRMAPVTASLQALADGYDAKAPLTVLEPLGRALAQLPDEDVEYIVHTCLEAVTMKQPGGGFAPVCKGGVMLFELELVAMLTLAGHVIRGNLSSFFSDLGSLLPQTGLTA